MDEVLRKVERELVSGDLSSIERLLTLVERYESVLTPTQNRAFASKLLKAVPNEVWDYKKEDKEARDLCRRAFELHNRNIKSREKFHYAGVPCYKYESEPLYDLSDLGEEDASLKCGYCKRIGALPYNRHYGMYVHLCYRCQHADMSELGRRALKVYMKQRTPALAPIFTGFEGIV